MDPFYLSCVLVEVNLEETSDSVAIHGRASRQGREHRLQARRRTDGGWRLASNADCVRPCHAAAAGRRLYAAEYDGVAALDFSPDSKRLAAALKNRFYVSGSRPGIRISRVRPW